MELQFGLAIVDEMSGRRETRRRMDGWMGQESRVALRLRTAGARALMILAMWVSPELGERQVLQQTASEHSA